MDGMGTANRSKAFHDVCWHNLEGRRLPRPHPLAPRRAAKKYPYYDIGRVGIYGTLGRRAERDGRRCCSTATSTRPPSSACGCHDNRMDKASWNEQWMGYPVGPHYAACSNIDNADKLRGKLLLIVGELDTNVPPESTLRLVDALIKAERTSTCWWCRAWATPTAAPTGGGACRTSSSHLHGVEPPDRNAVR